jgi:uncharacterized protein YbjT (DUF2867 family)
MSGMPPSSPGDLRCLVTGASGYVGGRLVPELLDAGMRVRCMTRSRDRLRDQPWVDRVEIVEADAADPGAVEAALDGVDVTYYLIHSMGGGPRFEEADRAAARSFATVAKRAGLGRLIYLGGLAPQGQELSPHMRSRGEVGEILLGSGVPTTVLAAGVILGSGSASFEMLRYLSERLPVMVTPKWVTSLIQPIAIRDVLRYLLLAATQPPDMHGSFDIGGPQVLTYQEMMHRYAQIAGLGRRYVMRVPVLSLSLSSHWIGLVTPIPSGLARPLVESLRHDAVCKNHAIAEHIPDPPSGLLGFDEAVRLALVRVREAAVATRWSSASVPGAPSDLLHLRIGDAIDFWRVEELIPGRLLRLRAEMRLPGLAWLELRVEPDPPGARYSQRAVFHPRGLAGQAYWWSIKPFHGLVFGAMARNIVRAAAESGREPHPSDSPRMVSARSARHRPPGAARRRRTT